MKTLLALVALIVLAMASGNGGQAPQKYTSIRNITDAKAFQQVQTICDKAHNEVSGASEEACGQAQAKTQTEYICSSLEANATCWVEAL